MAPCLRFLACSNGTVWFHFLPFRLGRVEGTPASSFGFVRLCLWCCCGWVSPSLSSPLSSTSSRAGIASDPTIRFAAGSLLGREVRCANGRDGRRRSSHVWWWQVATMSDVRPTAPVGQGRKTLPQLTGGKGGSRGREGEGTNVGRRQHDRGRGGEMGSLPGRGQKILRTRRKGGSRSRGGGTQASFGVHQEEPSKEESSGRQAPSHPTAE